MKRILFGVLLAGFLSSTAFAVAISNATLTVDNSRFYFDVTIDQLPATDFVAFRISTDHSFSGSNFERIQFNFDTNTGVTTITEEVKSFGTPVNDRWLDGPITDLVLTNTGAESWHVAGSVVHGAQPFVAGDTVSHVSVRTSSDVHLQDVPVGDYVAPGNPGSVTVSTISGNTTEAGGNATFTTVLDSQPTASVSIDLGSDNPAEGTVAPATLVFDNTNWDTPQVATVTGQDDAIVDGNIMFNIITGSTVSADANYSGIVVDDVSVINEDDDEVPVQPPAPAVAIPTLSDIALLLMAALLLLAGLRQKRIQ